MIEVADLEAELREREEVLLGFSFGFGDWRFGRGFL